MIGRNCRLLQGPNTEKAAVAELAMCIRERRPTVVRLTNYSKFGREFVNELSLHPVCDSRGVYRYIIGVQCDANASTVSSRTAARLSPAIAAATREGCARSWQSTTTF